MTQVPLIQGSFELYPFDSYKSALVVGVEIQSGNETSIPNMNLVVQETSYYGFDIEIGMSHHSVQFTWFPVRYPTRHFAPFTL